MKHFKKWAAFLAVLLSPLAAQGHIIDASSPGPNNWSELARAWNSDPLIEVLLAITAVIYLIGFKKLWQRSKQFRLKGKTPGLCFVLGWIVLFIALASPIHPWGNMLFSAHMTQHELLMLGAAPLLVLSRPGLVFLSAFPTKLAGKLVSWSKRSGLAATYHTLNGRVVSWMLHTVVLWAWHLPDLFQASLRSSWVHALQHSSFLAAAFIFWNAAIRGADRAAGYGAAVLYLFTTALQTGLLGALITLSRTPWYPEYSSTAMRWGLTTLEDQQLGGLIMWIPGGMVYVIAGLVLFGKWLRESAERAHKRETIQSPAAIL